MILIFQLVQIFSVKAVDYEVFSNADTNFSVISTSTNKENIPKTFSYEYFNHTNQTVEIIEGEGSVEIEQWRGSKRSYKLFLTTDAIIIEPTAYFAGWQTKVQNLDLNDSEWVQKDYFDNEEIKGRLAYQIKAGNYLVKTRFTQKTWSRLIANSFSAIVLLIVFSILIKWKKEVKKNN